MPYCCVRRLVIAAVRIFRFVPELGWKFRIARVYVRDVARQYWPITVAPNRKREGKNLEEAGEVSRGGTAKAAHDAVTGGRGVAFVFVYFANRHRQLTGSVKKISNTATEFPCGTVIIPRRILNVGDRACCKSNANQRHEQMPFHKPLQNLNNFSITKSISIF